jgi:hypothetical protein
MQRAVTLDNFVGAEIYETFGLDCLVEAGSHNIN